MRKLYLALAVLGGILPIATFFLLFTSRDASFAQVWQEFLTNPLSAAFSVDLVISSVVFLLLVFSEGPKLRMKNLWLFILFNLVGLSFALPLFLYWREKKSI